MNSNTSKKLYRSRDERIIAGVCGGLGAYFSLDPVIFRIAFVLATFASLIGLFVYITMWLLVPEGDGGYMYTDATYSEEKKEEGVSGDTNH